jgi:hypothetical protein
LRHFDYVSSSYKQNAEITQFFLSIYSHMVRVLYGTECSAKNRAYNKVHVSHGTVGGRSNHVYFGKRLKQKYLYKKQLA